MKRRVPSVPLRFVVVGLANTMIGLAIIYLLKWMVGVGDTAANVGAIPWALPRAFCSTAIGRSYHSGAWLPALARFLLLFAVAYAINLGTVLVLLEQFRMNGYAAQEFGIPPYTALFYLGSRYVSFQKDSSSLETELLPERYLRL